MLGPILLVVVKLCKTKFYVRRGLVHFRTEEIYSFSPESLERGFCIMRQGGDRGGGDENGASVGGGRESKGN